MASNKKFWRRDCDKSLRNIGRRSYWFREPSARREAVLPGSKLIRTAVVAGFEKNRERLPPNVFNSRGGCCRHFGIA
ncbi:MAG: hypothetical protein AMXMBFR44_2960 [Candidatus Campbellbacteria bacterium]